MRLRKETSKIKKLTEQTEQSKLQIRAQVDYLKFSSKTVEGVGKEVFICKYEDCIYQIKPCILNPCPLKKMHCK